MRCSFVGAVLVALVAGCSQLGSTGTLAERADKYWELKQTKRWEEVYDGYVDPAIKDKLSREAFLKKRLLAYDILSYTLTEAREDGDRGVVRVDSEANIPVRWTGGAVRLIQKKTMVEDEWVKRDGIWYVRFKE